MREFQMRNSDRLLTQAQILPSRSLTTLILAAWQLCMARVPDSSDEDEQPLRDRAAKASRPRDDGIAASNIVQGKRTARLTEKLKENCLLTTHTLWRCGC